MPSRFDITPADLERLLAAEPAYRARQVWAGLHQGREPGEMTDLPATLRTRLADELPPALTLLQESVSDGGDTVKWLWTLPDGAAVEAVLMRYPRRSTVCISSQAGCAMACTFCATGQAGFTRHLTAGEIVEQVVRANTRLGPGSRVSNTARGGAGAPPPGGGGDGGPRRVSNIHGDGGTAGQLLGRLDSG